MAVDVTDPSPVVPVGVTYDPAAGLARVITGKGGQTRAARRSPASWPRAGPAPGSRAANRGRWALLEGRATVRTEPGVIADAVRRYAERHERTLAPDPDRVVIEIALDRALGRA